MSERKSGAILLVVGVLSIVLAVLFCVLNPGVIPLSSVMFVTSAFGCFSMGFVCLGARKIGIVLFIITAISAAFSLYAMISAFLSVI